MEGDLQSEELMLQWEAYMQTKITPVSFKCEVADLIECK